MPGQRWVLGCSRWLGLWVLAGPLKTTAEAMPPLMQTGKQRIKERGWLASQHQWGNRDLDPAFQGSPRGHTLTLPTNPQTLTSSTGPRFQTVLSAWLNTWFFFKGFLRWRKMAQDSHNHLCGALEILLRASFIRGFVVRRLVFLFSLADLWNLRVSS